MVEMISKKAGLKEVERLAVLRRPLVVEFADIHCHCLPDMDDGPSTMAESILLCRTLVVDGITTVVATPHQFGSFEGKYEAGDIRRAVKGLNDQLQINSIPLKVLSGADVRVDERIPAWLKTDRILTLADGGRYLLLEQPHETIVDLKPLLRELSAMSITAIISHPERNQHLMRHPDTVRPWLENNAHLQITAGSLLGVFGTASEQSGWYFLLSGMASVVATDAHDLKMRCPRMLEAYYAISQRLGEKTAQKLCVANPRWILTGGEITRPDRVE